MLIHRLPGVVVELTPFMVSAAPHATSPRLLANYHEIAFLGHADAEL